MKKLNDLKTELATVTSEMEEIISRSDESGKRSKEDTQAWEEKNQRADELEAEIKRLEIQEARNKAIAKNKPTPEEKVKKRYDLGKALTEARSGKLTGLEMEMHQEAERELSKVTGAVGQIFIPSFFIKRANEETKTTGGTYGHIPEKVAGLDLVVSDPLYKRLGATVYENIGVGSLSLPFSQGHTADKVGEQSTASQSVPTQAKGSLTAGRYQAWQKYSAEYLAETAVMNSVLADMIEAIERGVGADWALDIIATSVMTGFTTSDTVAALDYNGILDIPASLTNDFFKNEAYIMSRELFYELAAKEKASNTARFIIENLGGKSEGRITGVPAVGTSSLPVHDTNKYDIAYGDMARTYVGFWGGVQILVDPYTSSDDGEVKITFSRMGDVDTNPYAVASKRNAAIS